MITIANRASPSPSDLHLYAALFYFKHCYSFAKLISGASAAHCAVELESQISSCIVELTNDRDRIVIG